MGEQNNNKEPRRLNFSIDEAPNPNTVKIISRTGNPTSMNNKNNNENGDGKDTKR